MLDIMRHLVDGGPKTVGPFHHAVSAGDYHFVTGQMPTLPEGPTCVVEGGIEAQTHRVMQNLDVVLKGLDSGSDRVVLQEFIWSTFKTLIALIQSTYHTSKKADCQLGRA